MEHKNNRKSGKKLLLTLAVVGGLLLLAFSILPDSLSPKNQKSGIVMAAIKDQTPVKLDLVNTQNGREIKLTEFVATANNFEFEYQFKIDDENLKGILKKNLAVNSNYQDIQFSVFADNKTENIALGGTSKSTFRVEGDTFVGSVIFNFDKKNMPEYANLTLHINKLYWEDSDKHKSELSEATKVSATSFVVPIALQYDGDWSFEIQNVTS